MRNSSDDERFFKYVEKLEGGCWLWTGANRGGYGVFKTGGRTIGARNYIMDSPNRITHKVGGILNQRACVNPEHLIVGGEVFANHSQTRARVLSDEEIEDIRMALNETYWGQQSDLAKTYGVSRTTIYHIKQGSYPRS